MTAGETTAELADRVRAEAELLARRRRPDPLRALPRAGEPLVFPAAPSQLSMWEEAHDNASAAPIILAGMRLRGQLEIGVLRRALAAVVARHETLRTVFRWRADELAQVILPGGTADLPLTRHRLEEYNDVAAAEVDRPFDLAAGPLFRCRLLELSDDDHIVLLVLHHIIGDARALEVFARDLTAYYLAFLAGTDPGLPDLTVQYADFAAWYAERLRGPRGQELIEYWVGRLHGAAPPRLPTDLASGPHPSVRGDTQRLPIPDRLVATAGELARQHRATLHMVGCAAFLALLALWSGQRDIAVRMPISYRDQREVADLIADFSNDIVFRIDLSDDPSFGELIDRVRHTAASDFAYKELPPRLLEPELGEPGLLERLFQVQFSTESDPQIELPLAELRAEPMPPRWRYAFRPLALRLRLTPAGADCIATYRTAVLSPERVTDMMLDYLDLLAELAADPDRRVLSGTAGITPALRVPCVAG
jgi:condensation domain-containing protein